ncbi:MAG: hypothetical protein MJ166_06440 [Clostridia bacterium]|nr:hypothetical protein [Clostridia bacterium]
MKSNRQGKTNKPKSTPVVNDENFFVSVLSCIHRTNVRFFMNLPLRFKNFVIRKYNDYKNKPKRTEINKVYVLVGYTTKKNLDNRFNSEHLMIVFRRILLIFIFLLLLIITLNWIRPLIEVDQYKQVFGVENVDDITSNDPFYSELDSSTSNEQSNNYDK